LYRCPRIQADLEDFHDRIRSVVERAWAEWRAIAGFRTESGYGPLLYPRTIANIMFDAIARNALAEFAADPSVHLVIEAQTIKLFFRGAVYARFKKGDDNKLGQNIPTQAALAFEFVDGFFPGLPAETAKVEFIWLANEINTQLEHVLVVARDGDRLLWDYEIGPAPAAGTGTVIPFPEPPTPPPPAGDGDDLVTPKTPAPGLKKPGETEYRPCQRQEICCASRGNDWDSRKRRRRLALGFRSPCFPELRMEWQPLIVRC
jgi:hypothetical protein